MGDPMGSGELALCPTHLFSSPKKVFNRVICWVNDSWNVGAPCWAFVVCVPNHSNLEFEKESSILNIYWNIRINVPCIGCISRRELFFPASSREDIHDVSWTRLDEGTIPGFEDEFSCLCGFGCLLFEICLLIIPSPRILENHCHFRKSLWKKRTTLFNSNVDFCKTRSMKNVCSRFYRLMIYFSRGPLAVFHRIFSGSTGRLLNVRPDDQWSLHCTNTHIAV